MKILWGDKDGGPESRVWVWGFEWKQGFSILLMNFHEGSREAWHTHAFNAVSWVIAGALKEHDFSSDGVWWSSRFYYPSWKPVKTLRSTYHKVEGMEKNNWVLSLRGPWVNTWKDNPGTEVTLTHGRKEIKPAKEAGVEVIKVG